MKNIWYKYKTLYIFLPSSCEYLKGDYSIVLTNICKSSKILKTNSPINDSDVWSLYLAMGNVVKRIKDYLPQFDMPGKYHKHLKLY